MKILELMPKRGLAPATSVWRKVLSTCCKNEKSRKATAILLDWVSSSVVSLYLVEKFDSPSF